MPNTIRRSLAAEIEALAAVAPDIESREKLRGVAAVLAINSPIDAAKTDSAKAKDDPGACT